MTYAIAYKNKQNLDFQGVPWIEGFFNDIDYAETVISENADKMSDPVIFTVPDLIEEQITWEYVNAHTIARTK
jgi:hypothetical protein